MKKDKVIFADFGKITTDAKERDEKLIAFICAILDVPSIQFTDVIAGIKTEKEKDAFINMICNDVKGRIQKFI